MLQMVAIPVQESELTPSPKYSMIAPVPPLTVRIPATLRITSIGEIEASDFRSSRGRRDENRKHTLRSGPSRDLTSKLDSNALRAFELPRKVSDDIDGISSSYSDSDHSKSSSVRGVRVGSDHESSGESVVLENDLREIRRLAI
jgi:hypothetical protein